MHIFYEVISSLPRKGDFVLFELCPIINVNLEISHHFES